MNNTDLHLEEQPRFYVRLNPANATATAQFRPLLRHLISAVGAEGAVVYLFSADANEFRAIATETSASPKIADLGVTLSAAATLWLRKGTEALQVRPATDLAFDNLPEGLQYGYDRIVLIPLRGEHDVLGFLTLGRRSAETFSAELLEGADPVVRLLAAVLERDELRRAMRERKLVERAKGIVQRKERLSEESAYLFLRNTSRRRRIALAELAREIIQTSVQRAA